MYAALLDGKGTGDESAATGLRDFIMTGYARLVWKKSEPALDVANTLRRISEQVLIPKGPPSPSQPGRRVEEHWGHEACFRKARP